MTSMSKYVFNNMAFVGQTNNVQFQLSFSEIFQTNLICFQSVSVSLVIIGPKLSVKFGRAANYLLWEHQGFIIGMSKHYDNKCSVFALKYLCYLWVCKVLSVMHLYSFVSGNDECTKIKHLTCKLLNKIKAFESTTWVLI